MVARFIHGVRLLLVLASRHRTLVLENLALQQQLAVYRRTRPKPPFGGPIGCSGLDCDGPGGTGSRPWWSSDPRRSSPGIAAVSRGTGRAGRARAAAGRGLAPTSDAWSGRWPSRTH